MHPQDEEVKRVINELDTIESRTLLPNKLIDSILRKIEVNDNIEKRCTPVYSAGQPRHVFPIGLGKSTTRRER